MASGPNTSSTCLARPWVFNISATIMFAPLIMKLRRVGRLFNNPTLKKMKITNTEILGYVALLVFIDVVLLLLWTTIERPRLIHVSKSDYNGVLLPVQNAVCSTGLSNPFEIVLIAYKSILIMLGVSQAVQTWNISSDLSEAKQFSIAIYNISVLGGLCYFLSIYLMVALSTPAAVRIRVSRCY